MLVWGTVSFVIIAHILSCISPGPDFAVVTRNTLNFSRRIGVFTALGVMTGILMHTTYCAFGLAAILLTLPKVFLVIRYLGGCYLVYIGAKAVRFKHSILQDGHRLAKLKEISDRKAYFQGFVVNATNPKCIFFVFSLFIMVAKLKSLFWNAFFILDMTFTTGAWFCFVAYLFSHSKIKPTLMRFNKPITQGLGVFLIIFGVELLVGK